MTKSSRRSGEIAHETNATISVTTGSPDFAPIRPTDQNGVDSPNEHGASLPPIVQADNYMPFTVAEGPNGSRHDAANTPDALIRKTVVASDVVDLGDADDLSDGRTAADDTTEANAPRCSEHSAVVDSMASSSITAGSAADDEQAVPQLSKQALESLLDELSGELVALEDFDGEVLDRAFEDEWLGRHTEISLAVFRAELLKTGEYTFNVDPNGKLLDDPVKYRLAPETGAQITLRVHRGLSEAQKSNFILLAQGRDRVRTEAENRELKRRIILAGLLQGLSYEAAGEIAGVCPNTARNVEKRAFADPNSKLEITQRPDGRFNLETLAKIAEAAELRRAGMANAEIAVIFDTDVESVGRWFKDASAQGKTKMKNKPGKKPKTGRANSRMQPATDPIEDIAASDGVPERHRLALQHLGLDASAYAEWLKEAVEKAEEDSDAAAGGVEESVQSELYFTQRAEVEKSRQRQILSPAGEADVKEAPGDSCSDGAGPTQVGDILLGIVKSMEPDEVFVVLPGGGGVIDTRDECLAMYAPLKEGGDVRVRVKGFDRKRETWKVQLQGLQTVAPAPGAIAASSDRDERRSPDTKVAGLKAGPREKEVI
jgi:hypothetical protein